MPNKFINFIIGEPKFYLRLIIIIIVIVSAGLVWEKQKSISTELKRVREEKQLISQIPELERQLAILGGLKIKDEELEKYKTIAKESLVLKGIYVQNNAYYALFAGDENFYQKGDTCGNFDILDINLNNVKVQNKITKNIEILALLQ